MTAPHPDLVCSDLTKDFDSFRAVDQVSFDVPQGSFFSILGPSGCGKTTLLRMIAGFQSPTSGDLRIKGRSMIGVPPNKRPVSMVFQHLALFPTMNIGDNIGFGLRQRGVGKSEIKTRVEKVLDASACLAWQNAGSTKYLAGKNNESRSRAVWCSNRTCCC